MKHPVWNIYYNKQYTYCGYFYIDTLKINRYNIRLFVLNLNLPKFELTNLIFYFLYVIKYKFFIIYINVLL